MAGTTPASCRSLGIADAAITWRRAAKATATSMPTPGYPWPRRKKARGGRPGRTGFSSGARRLGSRRRRWARRSAASCRSDPRLGPTCCSAEVGEAGRRLDRNSAAVQPARGTLHQVPRLGRQILLQRPLGDDAAAAIREDGDDDHLTAIGIVVTELHIGPPA